MSDNRNQISGWVRTWLGVCRELGAGDWIITGDYAAKVGLRSAFEDRPRGCNDN
jgi:hypothetical protein